MSRKLLSILSALILLIAPALVSAQVTATGRPSSATRVTLKASAAVTATAASTAVARMQNFKEALILLDVTVASTSGHTLDVCVQSTVNGADFFDVGCFGQITTASAQRIMRWHSYPGAGVTAEEAAPTAVSGSTDPYGVAGLTAGTVRQGPVGDQWRVYSTISGSTASYTYSVSGVFRE